MKNYRLLAFVWLLAACSEKDKTITPSSACLLASITDSATGQKTEFEYGSDQKPVKISSSKNGVLSSFTTITYSTGQIAIQENNASGTPTPHSEILFVDSEGRLLKKYMKSLASELGNNTISYDTLEYSYSTDHKLTTIRSEGICKDQAGSIFLNRSSVTTYVYGNNNLLNSSVIKRSQVVSGGVLYPGSSDSTYTTYQYQGDGPIVKFNPLSNLSYNTYNYNLNQNTQLPSGVIVNYGTSGAPDHRTTVQYSFIINAQGYPEKIRYGINWSSGNFSQTTFQYNYNCN